MSEPQILWRRVLSATIDTLRGVSRGQYDIRLGRPEGVESFFAGLPRLHQTSLGGYDLAVPVAAADRPIPVQASTIMVAYIGADSARADWRIPSQRPDTAYPLWREGAGLSANTLPGTDFIVLVRNLDGAFHARWLRAGDVGALPHSVTAPMRSGNAGVTRVDAGDWPSVAGHLDIPAAATDTGTARHPPSPPEAASIGRPYQPEDENVQTAPRDPFDVDPNVIDRGIVGHRRTQNALAKVLQDAGMSPRLCGPGEPEYDLGWLRGDAFYVAEVKSTTPANEERQLRLALGQVLRYAHALRHLASTIEPLIALERRPADTGWVELCDSLGVRLVWPETFESLLDGTGETPAST